MVNVVFNFYEQTLEIQSYWTQSSLIDDIRASVHCEGGIFKVCPSQMYITDFKKMVGCG